VNKVAVHCKPRSS